MFCWLPWEDTELGRPCWDTKKARRKRRQQQSYEETIAHQSSSWHYLVGVRHRLTSHAPTLPSLGHRWDAVRGERFRLAVSAMRLHHGVSVILLLLLLLLLATRCSWEVGAATAGLDGSKGGRERHRKGWLYLSLDTLLTEEVTDECDVTVEVGLKPLVLFRPDSSTSISHLSLPCLNLLIWWRWSGKVTPTPTHAQTYTRAHTLKQKFSISIKVAAPKTGQSTPISSLSFNHGRRRRLIVPSSNPDGVRISADINLNLTCSLTVSLSST